MRTSMSVLASAALLLASAAGAAGGARPAIVVAQGMTGSAGSNSATTAVSPHTDPGPDPAGSGADHVPRTSRDNGTSNPIAGDELDHARRNADAGRDGARAPAGGVPAPRATGR